MPNRKCNFSGGSHLRATVVNACDSVRIDFRVGREDVLFHLEPLWPCQILVGKEEEEDFYQDVHGLSVEEEKRDLSLRIFALNQVSGFLTRSCSLARNKTLSLCACMHPSKILLRARRNPSWSRLNFMTIYRALAGTWESTAVARYRSRDTVCRKTARERQKVGFWRRCSMHGMWYANFAKLGDADVPVQTYQWYYFTYSYVPRVYVRILCTYDTRNVLRLCAHFYSPHKAETIKRISRFKCMPMALSLFVRHLSDTIFMDGYNFLINLF